MIQNRLPKRRETREHALNEICPITGVYDDIVRNRIIDEIIAKIRNYFPKEEMANAELLAPTNLPESANEINAYSNRIRSFARSVGHDELQAMDEFGGLLRIMFRLNSSSFRLNSSSLLLYSLISDECKFLLAKKTLSPLMFWKNALLSHEAGPIISELIQLIFVIPPNSASAERAFSIAFYIRGKRQSRFAADKIDQKMR